MGKDKNKNEAPTPVKESKIRKASARRNGVPSLNRDRTERARDRLLTRPLHEYARTRRLMRKLQIFGRFDGGIRN